MQFIQTSIHPNGGARLTYFTDEFPQHQKLCNNMILSFEKLEIISVLIAGLDLDVRGSKYAPLFILHLYFSLAARNSYDTSLLSTLNMD
jgi:hypothetical protein